MIRDEIAHLVREAARAAQRAGELPAVTLPEVEVERPRLPENGDYATNLALRLKKAVAGPGAPIDLARVLVKHVPASPMIREATAAMPGFVNFFLSDRWLQQQVEMIIAAGEQFGASQLGAGRRIQVEFVSANPTGPLHVGNGRGSVTGSTLAAVLQSAGYEVEREYYVNDAGTQTDVFGRTLYARYLQLFGVDASVPEDGYPGEYMVEIARSIKAQHGDRFLGPVDAPPPPLLKELGIERVIGMIRDDLALIGVRYDRWFSERSLFGPEEGGGSESLYQRVMRMLKERGHTVEREGAVWFTSAGGEQDKDDVLVRTGGAPTYFASDIAYHYDKFAVRGFDRVVDIWGADHPGHVARLMRAMDALGIDPGRLTILLYQLVTLKRGNQVVRLAKRAGEIITLREVVEEVGPDAVRFFFLMRSPDAAMDFDLELAKRQSDENPVFYVQYAHARIAGILRNAAQAGVSDEGGDVTLLTHPSELNLVRTILRLPELLDDAARRLEVHGLPHYALTLATDFHAFYRDCRVLTDDVELSRARLKLVHAARVTFARVLGLMGVSAPERMLRADEAEPAPS
ncbi:MAG TPA: arginine--tRNA ligase [Dehalococcoidia bacterium]|nr:arginine--tRNA ligase [Dehalococcoidia bacterium]